MHGRMQRRHLLDGRLDDINVHGRLLHGHLLYWWRDHFSLHCMCSWKIFHRDLEDERVHIAMLSGYLRHRRIHHVVLLGKLQRWHLLDGRGDCSYLHSMRCWKVWHRRLDDIAMLRRMQRRDLLDSWRGERSNLHSMRCWAIWHRRLDDISMLR